jgi:hypothetical protein
MIGWKKISEEIFFKWFFFFFFLNTTHNPLKSGSEIGGQHRQYNTLDTTQTHTQAKNYSFSQSPTIHNCAENTLSIMSICETNSSSKSSIYQSLWTEPRTKRLRVRCLPNWSIEDLFLVFFLVFGGNWSLKKWFDFFS